MNKNNELRINLKAPKDWMLTTVGDLDKEIRKCNTIQGVKDLLNKFSDGMLVVVNNDCGTNISIKGVDAYSPCYHPLFLTGWYLERGKREYYIVDLWINNGKLLSLPIIDAIKHNIRAINNTKYYLYDYNNMVDGVNYSPNIANFKRAEKEFIDNSKYLFDRISYYNKELSNEIYKFSEYKKKIHELYKSYNNN